MRGGEYNVPLYADVMVVSKYHLAFFIHPCRLHFSDPAIIFIAGKSFAAYARDHAHGEASVFVSVFVSVQCPCR